jgi:hypothetical protein
MVPVNRAAQATLNCAVLQSDLLVSTRHCVNAWMSIEARLAATARLRSRRSAASLPPSNALL